MPTSFAERRYNRRVLLLSLCYALLLIAASELFKVKKPVGLAAYIFAILPALPVIGMFAAVGRYLIEETDEYVRMLMVRQTLIASGFALAVATAWGFLESFGIVRHMDAYFVVILWYAGLGSAAFVNRLRTGPRS